MTPNTRHHNWITERHFRTLSARQKLLEQAGELHQSASLSERLRAAVVVSPKEVMPQRVQFGAHVTVFLIEEGEEQSFQIVSDDESDIGAGRLGASSPLALALFGAREGDTVEVTFGAGAVCDYEVTHIKAMP